MPPQSLGPSFENAGLIQTANGSEQPASMIDSISFPSLSHGLHSPHGLEADEVEPGENFPIVGHVPRDGSVAYEQFFLATQSDFKTTPIPLAIFFLGTTCVDEPPRDNDFLEP